MLISSSAVIGMLILILISNDSPPYQFCILPIPSEEQKYLNNTNPFNEIDSDGGRDKGFDFEFWFDPNSENLTVEDLSNGYKLRRIIAPCSGKIEMIQNATDYYCPGYGVMIAIKHGNDWFTSIALETNSNDTNVQDIQDANILVTEGENVERGDTLAYFCVMNNTIKDEPDSGNPLVDWGLYPIVEGVPLSEKLREYAVCPYMHCIDEAKIDLENLFRHPDGTVGEICIP